MEGTSWVFGYATLIYKADFQYEAKLLGRIRKFSRKFHYLSIRERGTIENPGIIATLVPNPDGIVWGVAYKIKDFIWKKMDGVDSEGFSKIKTRFYPLEKQRRGGHGKHFHWKSKNDGEKPVKYNLKCKIKEVNEENLAETSHKRVSKRSRSKSRKYDDLKKSLPNPVENFDCPYKGSSNDESIEVIVYMGNTVSGLYNFENDPCELAKIIVTTAGNKGTNVDYITSLADNFRMLFPDKSDNDLFGLEREVLKLISSFDYLPIQNSKLPQDDYIER